MKQFEDKMRDAFNEVRAPEELKRTTLESIEAKRPAKTKRPFFTSIGAKVALAACVLMVAFGVGGGAYAYSTPTAYVDVEVNPSVELGVNCFNYVVSAEGINEDGAALLEDVSLQNLRYDEAIQKLDNTFEDQGYLTDATAVNVRVVCENNNQYAQLESTTQTCFQSAGQGVNCARANNEERQQARAVGMGIGKYEAWQALVEAGVDISSNQAAQMTMAELRTLANQEGVEFNQPSGQGHNQNQQGNRMRKGWQES